MKSQSIKRKYLKQTRPFAAIGAFILNSKNQILLVRSYKWKDLYSIPGGRIELGEKSEDTVKREVKEEVGLEVESVSFLCPVEAIYSEEFFFNNKHFIFLEHLCRVKGNENPKIDNNEIQSTEWVNLLDTKKRKINSCTRFVLDNYLIPLFKENKL